ncbi:hypothetical protein ACFLXQ_07430 [Chloroflexota bacterium]
MKIRHSQSRVVFWGIPVLVTVLAFTSCWQSEPPTVTLDVNPGTQVSVNQSVAIVANIDPYEELDFKWTVTGNSGGNVEPNTGEQVIYTAGNSPGTDIVVAEGTQNGNTRVKQTVTFIVEAGPSPPPVVKVIRSEEWPENKQEAAELFSKGQGEWTQNQYEGWTLTAVWPPIEVFVPAGVTFEGYNDGANPPETFKCYTVLGTDQVTIQGGTFWYPDDPSDPAWTAKKVHNERPDKDCITSGFTPD